MAVEIIKGADAAKLSVRKLSEALPVINEKALADLGIEIPAAYANAVRVK